MRQIRVIHGPSVPVLPRRVECLQQAQASTGVRAPTSGAPVKPPLVQLPPVKKNGFLEVLALGEALSGQQRAACIQAALAMVRKEHPGMTFAAAWAAVQPARPGLFSSSGSSKPAAL